MLPAPRPLVNGFGEFRGFQVVRKFLHTAKPGHHAEFLSRPREMTVKGTSWMAPEAFCGRSGPPERALSIIGLWTAMNEKLRSVLTGTAGLSAAAILALVLMVLRGPADGDPAVRERTARIFLIGLAAQCLHFTEEFVTRFQDRFPALLGLAAWPENFFVIFNLIWLAVWILSAAGLQRGYRMALFPAWFFAIVAIANGVAHPVLTIVAGGYFPGLITSPAVGVLGALLWSRLQTLTKSTT
jgi:Protein of unknown function with HXXEE motif